MSVQAMSWALAQQLVVDPTARHVLLCLANYADKDGCAAFPSATSLAEDTGLSLRTVRYKLEQLQGLGAIRLGNQAIVAAYIDRGDRRPVVYDLAMERGAAVAPRSSRSEKAKRGASVALREVERDANENTTGCNSEHYGVQLTTERGAPVAPNPSFNHPVTISEPREQSARTDSGSLMALDLDWQPNPDLLKAYAKRAGLPVEVFTPEALAPFVLHHSANGLAKTETQWVAALVKWVLADRQRANRVVPLRPKTGAPDVHGEDSTWADDLGVM